GLGRAIARHLLDKGANVMFADMDEARLEDEVGEEARAEGAVRMFAGDLRKKLAITNLLSATMDAFERVDILVNASRQVLLSEPLEAEGDAVETMLQQNLYTSLRVSQQTARRMIAQAGRSGEAPSGSIINLSCIAAQRSRPELFGFSIATAAVDQMTRALALALAPSGIRVNAIALGSVMSASLQAALKDNPGYREAITRGTPFGRIAGPAEVVEAVQYLASDAAAFMTGQILTIDGGRSLIDPVAAPAH
ncbi:MAG: SDR family oxidoreductase, partial [Gemmobacter sp.]|nr:SDR family oxidoreductase [Gemmobacter sp.]